MKPSLTEAEREYVCDVLGYLAEVSRSTDPEAHEDFMDMKARIKDNREISVDSTKTIMEMLLASDQLGYQTEDFDEVELKDSTVQKLATEISAESEDQKDNNDHYSDG